MVGVSKAAQIEDLVKATELELEQEDIDYLEALYQPLDNLLTLGMS